MKTRGFEKISKYAASEFPMPERKTQKSAGYDIHLPEDIELFAGQAATGAHRNQGIYA